jgi:hypothetical protein
MNSFFQCIGRRHTVLGRHIGGGAFQKYNGARDPPHMTAQRPLTRRLHN